jgi:hypothetical protein
VIVQDSRPAAELSRTDYEAVIREAVREVMRAPELVHPDRTLRPDERALLIAQLRLLLALLYRLLEAISS